MEKINSMGEYSKADMKTMIEGIESVDYDDEENSHIEEYLPREYRDEIVAWLREEYL